MAVRLLSALAVLTWGWAALVAVLDRWARLDVRDVAPERDGPPVSAIVPARDEERFRAILREGRERGELRPDLDEAATALLLLSAANWAYTWLTPERDTDELADAFAAILVDGIRGYAPPR